jgi:cell division cycle protein 20 (cofactor of APC complex)
MCNLQNEENGNPNAGEANLPSAQMLKEQIFEGQASDSKILAFKEKPKAADAGYLNHMRVLYTQNKANAAAPKHKYRAISSAPERILDAPDISDDYYLNLLDWSAQNVLAVALGPAVYLWNAQRSVSLFSFFELFLLCLYLCF